MARRERDILERAVRLVSGQAKGGERDRRKKLSTPASSGSHPVTLQANRPRLALLKVKADLEQELRRLVLDCSRCGQTVH